MIFLGRVNLFQVRTDYPTSAQVELQPGNGSDVIGPQFGSKSGLFVDPLAVEAEFIRVLQNEVLIR